VRTRVLLATLFLVCLASGCTTPRVVKTITSTPEQIKFGYEQQTLFLVFPTGSETGIVRCKIGEDGLPTECRNLQLNFSDS
jgi:hypothetical protein